ncbi:MAG TPA: nitrilase-related carbon-nitrogen hydrolase [Capillimicrobium sp.]
MPRLAVVQIEPSYMDPEGGLRRIERFAADAARQGAEIVVFPELLVPGYPRYVGDPFPRDEAGEAAWADNLDYHRAYVEHSQLVPGPYTQALGAIARAHAVSLVVGLSERHARIRSTLFNTGVVFAPDGRLIGRHRKLVAVMHERLIFNRGGVEDIRTFQTPEANLGVCICFENHQPLFRRALGRLGEEIHCALWTGPTPREKAAAGVRHEQHRELGVAHALDTGTFVAISSQVTAREPGGEAYGSNWSHSGGSYIINPFGETIASVPDWEEGIAIADCDLQDIDRARLVWNAFSDDARDDLFEPPVTIGSIGGPPLAAPAALLAEDPALLEPAALAVDGDAVDVSPLLSQGRRDG